jgi:hypothetical protein
MSSDTGSAPAPRDYPFVPAGTRVFPNLWPGEPLKLQPGNVEQFAPMGFIMGGPMVVRPWDTLESAAASQGYYGAQHHSFHPLLGAPRTDACGGVMYFDTGESRESLLTAFSVMGLRAREEWREFAVFCQQSSEPEKSGFISHCRIMPMSAPGYLYVASLEHIDGAATPQPVSVPEVLWHFVKSEEERWGTGMGGALSGCMGGDGDWAKESLCFGFMMENHYHSIFRIWSRAELVTK